MTSIVTLYKRLVHERAPTCASTFTTQLGKPVYNVDRATPISIMDMTIQNTFCYFKAMKVSLSHKRGAIENKICDKLLE